KTHFREEVKQYFALGQPKKRLKHLNHDLSTYLYAILLMITGEHEEGPLKKEKKHGIHGPLLNWRTNMLSVD
ncbi:unnamed protein product, partial [Brassica rapa subsp. trilocularis]